MTAKTGKRSTEPGDRIIAGDGVGQRPNAELSLLDAGAEVARVYVDQIRCALVERTQMRAPGQKADGVDTRSAQGLGEFDMGKALNAAPSTPGRYLSSFLITEHLNPQIGVCECDCDPRSRTS